MPGVVLPIQNLNHEERRNVILRLRYGPQQQSTRKPQKGKLRVVGQAMEHSPRNPAVANIQALISAQKYHLTGKREFLATDKTSIGCAVVTKLKMESSHRGKIRAPPTTPLGVRPCSGAYDPTRFQDGGEGGDKDVIAKSAPTNEKSTKATMASVSGGDIGPEKGIPKKQPTGLEGGLEEYTAFERSTRRGNDNLQSWPSTEEGGPAVLVSKPARRSLGDIRETIEKKHPPSKSSSSRKTTRRSSIPRRASSPQMHRSSHERSPSNAKASSKVRVGRRKSSLIKLRSVDGAKRSQNKENATDDEMYGGPSKEELQDLEGTVIRKFLNMPTSKPKYVCFDHPGVDLTYVDVKQAIEEVIPDAFEENKIVSVQFENINVKLGTGHRSNRWHIQTRDFSTRNKLIKSGLVLRPGKDKDLDNQTPVVRRSDTGRVEVKLYDMVIMEEYKLFLRRNAAEEKLQNVILMCAGRGHALLSNML